MKHLILVLLQLIAFNYSFSQQTTILPGNAELDNKNTNSALVIPKLSYQTILDIPNPKVGSLIYDIDNNCIRIYNSTEWVCLTESKDIPFNLSKSITSQVIGVSQTGPQTAGSISINSVTVDTQGNFYLGGTISGCFSSPISICSSYSTYMYPVLTGIIMKFSSSGAFKWSTIVSGKKVIEAGNVDSNFQSAISDIIIKDDKLYAVGSYKTSISWQNVELNSTGGRDAFIAKLDTSKTLNWIKNIGGNLDEEATTIQLDNNNYIFIAGTFQSSTLTIGVSPNAIVLNNGGGSDIFLAKYDTNGNLQNAIKIGGPNNDNAIDLIYEQSYFYLAGTFNQSFYTGNCTLTGAGTSTFIAQFNSLLSFSGCAAFSGTNPNDEIVPAEIKRINNQIFMCGRFKGNILIGDKTLSSTEYSSFITAFYFPSASLSLSYLQTINNPSGFNSFAINNSNGKVYIVGNFQNMNSTIGIPLQSKGNTDIALFELKTDGYYNSTASYTFSGYTSFGTDGGENVGKVFYSNGKMFFLGTGVFYYNPRQSYLYLWSY